MDDFVCATVEENEKISQMKLMDNKYVTYNFSLSSLSAELLACGAAVFGLKKKKFIKIN